MDVRIIVLETGETADAQIRKGNVAEMPSLQEGWRFNFQKRLGELEHATGYLLVKKETPDVVEGCMIFQLIDKRKPYMAYLEVAPHNKKEGKKHDNVAGCLIAYAYKLSVMRGIGPYNAALHFDVLEENSEDEIRLMKLYSMKYKAFRLANSTTMAIYDADGDWLVQKYLV
jgi:hypothetical protein